MNFFEKKILEKFLNYEIFESDENWNGFVNEEFESFLNVSWEILLEDLIQDFLKL